MLLFALQSFHFAEGYATATFIFVALLLAWVYAYLVREKRDQSITNNPPIKSEGIINGRL